MKPYTFGNVLLLGLLLLLIAPAGAQSIQDEYAQLIARRVQSEKRVEELHNTLLSVERRTPELEEAWLKCANGRWRFVWNSTVKNANESREALETQRQRLFTLNKQLRDRNFDLDQERRKIEHEFPTKGFEYETAFRRFMHLLENEYLFRLENEYFHGFERYLSGIKSYHAFVEHALQACNSNDVTPIAIEQGLQYVNEILEVTKALKDLIKGA